MCSPSAPLCVRDANNQSLLSEDCEQSIIEVSFVCCKAMKDAHATACGPDWLGGELNQGCPLLNFR